MSNQELTIGNIQVRQTESGLYCLNDLHKASVMDGHVKRTKEPSKWMATNQSKELIETLTTQNLGSLPIETMEGKAGGTYACKELVYAYAMWLSPKFCIRVIRAFDAIASGQETKALALAGTQAAADRLALLDDDLVKQYISNRKRELRQLESQANKIRESLSEMDLDGPDTIGDQVTAVAEMLGRRKKAGRNWLTVAETKDSIKNLKLFKGLPKLSTYLVEKLIPELESLGIASLDGKTVRIN